MQRDDRSYLLDMLVAARDAVAFTKGLSYDEFAKDRRSQLATLKSAEIVGEAAANVVEVGSGVDAGALVPVAAIGFDA